MKCAILRCEEGRCSTRDAPIVPETLRRSCRKSESAYLTLVACRRVEAGHAGPSGGVAFTAWNVLRPRAYACLCTPFYAYPLECQCQVRTLENPTNPAPIHTDGGDRWGGLARGTQAWEDPTRPIKEHAV